MPRPAPRSRERDRSPARPSGRRGRLAPGHASSRVTRVLDRERTEARAGSRRRQSSPLRTATPARPPRPTRAPRHRLPAVQKRPRAWPDPRPEPRRDRPHRPLLPPAVRRALYRKRRRELGVRAAARQARRHAGPRAEHGRHQLVLIDLSRVARDLPWFALRHALDAATLRRASGSPARRCQNLRPHLEMAAAPHTAATCRAPRSAYSRGLGAGLGERLDARPVGTSLTAYSDHSPGKPLSVTAPRFSNSMPAPAPRSLTVLDTRTSPD